MPKQQVRAVRVEVVIGGMRDRDVRIAALPTSGSVKVTRGTHCASTPEVEGRSALRTATAACTPAKCVNWCTVPERPQEPVRAHPSSHASQRTQTSGVQAHNQSGNYLINGLGSEDDPPLG